jgi:UDP-GlcNAc3NAcA epimerase
LKVLTVVGARPQFIKAAAVSRALAAAGCEEVIVHTGQHYEIAMSDVFFERMGIAEPRYHLGVGSASHGAQTGRMLEEVEKTVLAEKPDVLLVYGDTNSTLAGALAAVKLHVPVAHVEAGLRSFNRRMPEELNRVLTDHAASLLFAPTDSAVANLRNEGITEGVVRTGDVMLDTALLFAKETGEEAAQVPARFGVEPGRFALLTLHRAENTDVPERWQSIADGIARVGRELVPVLWLVHPRVRERAKQLQLENVTVLDPQPYFETQALLMNARVVLTDSGGLQKEASFHRVPCVTLRDETEWVELLDAGVNRLAGADPEAIFAMAADAKWPGGDVAARLYGDGRTSEAIAAALLGYLEKGARA